MSASNQEESAGLLHMLLHIFDEMVRFLDSVHGKHLYGGEDLQGRRFAVVLCLIAPACVAAYCYHQSKEIIRANKRQVRQQWRLGKYLVPWAENEAARAINNVQVRHWLLVLLIESICFLRHYRQPPQEHWLLTSAKVIGLQFSLFMLLYVMPAVATGAVVAKLASGDCETGALIGGCASTLFYFLYESREFVAGLQAHFHPQHLT